MYKLIKNQMQILIHLFYPGANIKVSKIDYKNFVIQYSFKLMFHLSYKTFKINAKDSEFITPTPGTEKLR
jgi:hypothetical protein